MTNHSNSRNLLWIWLVLFLLSILFFFSWNEPLRRIALNLRPLPVSLIYMCSLAGFGWPVMKKLTSGQNQWIQFITSVAFGMALNAILVLVLGTVGNFHPVIFQVWLLLGLILFVAAVRSWMPFTFPRMEFNSWNILAISIIAAFLATALPFVVAPDASTDTVEYHLLIPRMYLQLGHIQFLPLLVEASYPSFAEYNYLPLLQLTNEIVCKCFHFWIGILAVILVAQTAKQAGKRIGGWLAAAFFISMPVTIIHMGWAWNDFIFNLFILLGLYYLLQFHLSDEKRVSNFFVAGALIGLASWTKYTFVIFFGGFCLLLAVGHLIWNWKWKSLLLFFAGFVLIVPFWAVQNWILTGNPVYPFLNTIFQSPYWTENSASYFYHAVKNHEIPNWNWTTFFLFPFFITLKPRLMDVHTGVLPLVFIPFLFITSKSKGFSFLRTFLFCSALIWLFIHSETRSIYSIFAILFCCAAIAIQQLQWHSVAIKRIAIGLISIAAVSNLFVSFVTIYYLWSPIAYFIGQENKTQYLRRIDKPYRAYEWLNNNADVKTVLLVGLHGPFYLNRHVIFSSFGDPPAAEVVSENATSPEMLAAKLRSMGITHIVIDMGTYQDEQRRKLYSWSVVQRNLFQAFVNTQCKPEFRDRDIVIVTLKPMLK